MYLDITTGIPGRGHYCVIELDGVEYDYVLRADDERGYIDVITGSYTKRFGRTFTIIHRLWGNVRIHIANYYETPASA